MNRDEILEFAKDVWGRDKLDKGRDNQFDFYVDLVRAAMAKEREACAQMCEAYMAEGIGREMARAIRERGNDEPR